MNAVVFSRRRVRIGCGVLFGLAGCGEPSRATSLQDDAPTRAAQPAAQKEEAPPPLPAAASPTLPTALDCVDGEALREALLGAAMRACAKSVSKERAVELAWGDVDSAAASQRWDPQERTACATACRAWTEELNSLVVPECADEPHFPDALSSEILLLSRAGAALRVGAAEPAQQRIVANALLAGADGSFALARGQTLGGVIAVGGFFLQRFDDLVDATRATTPASTARRAALVDAIPTAAHRWGLYQAQIRSLRTETSRDAFPGHVFVLTDAPSFTDDTFDTRTVPPEVWDDAIDALLEFRCEGTWDACRGALSAVPKHFTDGVDEAVMRDLFWTPGRFEDLDEPQRQALQAALRQRATDYFITTFNHESSSVAELRRGG